jgi:TetR/AcrR family transcriptional regulator
MPKPRLKAGPVTPRDGATEQRILDAAHAVFIRRGTAGARMQEIAAEAGVNKALLHYYFRSKERLAEAVFRRVAGQLLPPVAQVLASDAPIEAKVERVIELELTHLSATPYLPGYVISELSHQPERVRRIMAELIGTPLDQVRFRLFGALRRQIAERVQAGTMRPIEPEQFVVNLLALCIFPFAVRPFLETVFGEGEQGFERFIAKRRRELAGFFLAGLGVR